MKTYIRNNDTITGKLHDEQVMLDIEKGKYFSLNPVATHIWNILEKPYTVNGLCEVLLREFEVEENQCKKEVAEHLKEMLRLGLVKVV